MPDMFSAPNQRVPLTAFVSKLTLFVLSGEAFADAINNPFHQMKRQQQLQQESKSYGLNWEEMFVRSWRQKSIQRRLLKIITTGPIDPTKDFQFCIDKVSSRNDPNSADMRFGHS